MKKTTRRRASPLTTRSAKVPAAGASFSLVRLLKLC
jgi:hypothetical protein